MKDLVKVGEELTTLQLVVEDDKILVANTAPLEKFVSALEVHFEEKKNELDLEKFETAYKNQVAIWKNFDTYRKGALSHIASIPKQITGIMNNDWKNVLDNWSSEIEKRKEAVYVLADANINTVLNSFLADENEKVKAQLDLRVFDKEFSKIRTTSYAQLTDKDKIKKSLSDKIEALYVEAVTPIRERIALEEQTEREHKNFDMMLSKYNIDSNDIDVLNNVIVELETFKLEIPTMYSTIKTTAERSINFKIDNAKKSIQAIKAEQARLEQQRQLDELKNADKDIMNQVEAIKAILPQIQDDRSLLEENIEKLKRFWKDAKYAENRTTIQALSETLKERKMVIEFEENQRQIEAEKAEKVEPIGDIEMVTPFDMEEATKEDKIIVGRFDATGKEEDILAWIATAKQFNITVEGV